ncbi:MAG: GNAT family N-acetyltransferase [Holdemanella sp.]|nr:GNAT family N-acetyltransferase [Holdemanella sp.]
MITHNAIGWEADVEYLLSKSLLNMDRLQIKAWMKYQFDPSNMYCAIEDNKVVSCLQIKRRTMSFHNQKCSVSVITMVATLPDYRQRGYFESLLEASMNQANQNDLITILHTTFPKLFEKRSFQTIVRTKEYWIPAIRVKEGNDKHVKAYTNNMDLYPAYLKFIHHFDGCIIYSKKEFEEQIQYHLQYGKKLIVSFDDSNNITGFAIYKTTGYAKIEFFIYHDANAVYDIIRYLSIRSNTITFTVSENERFEKLYALDYPKIQETVLAKLNNYKLFSKWVGQDVHNIQQAYDLLDKPCWNHFID